MIKRALYISAEKSALGYGRLPWVGAARDGFTPGKNPGHDTGKLGATDDTASEG